MVGDVLKSALRLSYFRKVCDADLRSKLVPVALCSAFLGFPIAVLNFGALASALIGNEVKWSGKAYRVLGPTDVSVRSLGDGKSS
jgi:hypothetical protein